MKVIKKVIAVITVAIIVIRIMIFNAVAIGPAAIAAEALAELFGMLLCASGVATQQQVDNMSWGEMEPLVKDGISNGTINPRVSLNLYDLNMTWLEFITDPDLITKEYVNAVWCGADFIDNWLSFLTSDDVLLTDNYFALDDAYGAYVATNINSNSIFSGEYVVFDNNTGYAYVFASDGEKTIRQDIPRGDGTYSTYTIPLSLVLNGRYYYPVKISYVVSYGGDCTTIDGEVLESVNGIPQVGETADGTAVTLDDIQSGAVSVDDVNLDYEKFDDSAIIDLLNQILSVIDSSPVVDTSDNTITSDIADSVSVSLDISELNNLQVPTGISSVFPFCLPFDFVRGLQLLSAKPVAPVFEIPFNIPSFGLFSGSENTITLDMSDYSKYFDVLRWVQVIIFSISLCFISYRLVQGVH